MTTFSFEENTAKFTTPNGEISINDGGSFLRVVKGGVETVNLPIGEKEVIPLFAYVHGETTYVVCSVPFNILIGVISDQGVQFFTAKVKEGESTRPPNRGEMEEEAAAEEVLVSNNIEVNFVVHNGGWELFYKSHSRYNVDVFPAATGFCAGIFVDESLVTLMVNCRELSAEFGNPYPYLEGEPIAHFTQAEGFFIATASNYTHKGENIRYLDDLYNEENEKKRLFLMKMNLAIYKMNSDQEWSVYQTFEDDKKVVGHLLFLKRENGGVKDDPEANDCDMLETDGDDRITEMMINYETSTLSLTVVFSV